MYGQLPTNFRSLCLLLLSDLPCPNRQTGRTVTHSMHPFPSRPGPSAAYAVRERPLAQLLGPSHLAPVRSQDFAHCPSLFSPLESVSSPATSAPVRSSGLPAFTTLVWVSLNDARSYCLHFFCVRCCPFYPILQVVFREHLKMQVWSLCIPILLRIKVKCPTVAPAFLPCGLCGRSFSVSRHHWSPPTPCLLILLCVTMPLWCFSRENVIQNGKWSRDIVQGRIRLNHVKLLILDHFDLENDNFLWFNQISSDLESFAVGQMVQPETGQSACP